MLTQAEVFVFRRNLVVAASAGTGKTFTLAGVVLYALLGASAVAGPKDALVPPERIVATTFSKRAAAEIRERIERELHALAEGEDCLYLAGLVAQLGSPELVRKRARALLPRIARLRIGTLHSLAFSLLREHGGAGFGDSVETIDGPAERALVLQLAAAELERLARESHLEFAALATAAGSAGALLEELVEYVLSTAEDGGSAAVAAEVAGSVADCLERLRCGARLLCRKDGTPVAEALAFLSYGPGQESEPGFAEALTELIALRAFKDTRQPADPRIEEFFAYRSSLPGNAAAERSARVLGMLARSSEFEPLARSFVQIASNLTRAMEAELAALQRISFASLLRATRDLLRDSPSIAAAMGAEMSLLLVDEFQDTSKVQRDIVCLLWEARQRAPNAHWVADYSALRPQGLFLVGDRKQAIYGFRGASITTFAEACVGMAGADAAAALGLAPAPQLLEGTAGQQPQAAADFLALQVNRRGTPELLALTNRLCRHLFEVPNPADLRPFELAYAAAFEDLRAPEGVDVAVADPLRAPAVQWLVPAGDSSASATEEDAEVLAQAIAARHEQGAQYKDMAVLARANSVLGAVACALEARGIPYVVAGGGFYRTKEVRDLAALVRLLWNPADKLAFASVLRGSMVALTDDSLLALAEPGKGLLPLGAPAAARPREASLEAGERARFEHAESVLLRAARAATQLGPAQLVAQVISDLQWREVQAALPRGVQRLANVDKLLALLEPCLDLHAAVLALEQMGRAGARAEEAMVFIEEDNAVRLLTMHASKGLQFRHVFVPRAGAPARAVRSGLVYRDFEAQPPRIALRLQSETGATLTTPEHQRMHNELARRETAESRRLLYVAVTRAEASLTFIGRPRAAAEGKTTTAPVAAVLAALAPGEPAGFVVQVDVPTYTPPATAPAALQQAVPDAARSAFAAESAASAPAEEAPAWLGGPVGTAALSPTALSDFLHCARRFAFVHLWDIPEERPNFARKAATPRAVASASALAAERAPGGFESGAGGAAGWDLDYRLEGTLLHAALEVVELDAFGADAPERAIAAALTEVGVATSHARFAVMSAAMSRFLQSPYACAARAAGAQIEREVPFEAQLGAADNWISLRGSMDLLLRFPSGEVHVVDYKRARGPSIAPYRFQLESYQLAASVLVPEALQVRAGVFFLGASSASDVQFLDAQSGADAQELAALRTRLPLLAQELAHARAREHYPRAQQTKCAEIKCAYAPRCYPKPRPVAIVHVGAVQPAGLLAKGAADTSAASVAPALEALPTPESDPADTANLADWLAAEEPAHYELDPEFAAEVASDDDAWRDELPSA